MYNLKDNSSEIVSKMLDTTTGLPSGIAALDRYLLGFSPSELIVIAARPGVGKSSFARDIALSIGRTNTIVLFSLEMNYQEIAELLLTNLAQINYYGIKRDGVTDSIRTRLDTACTQLSTYKIIIVDESYLTPAHVRDTIIQLKKTDPPVCVIIDYLQLMRVERRVNREAEVSEISRELLSMSKEFNIPIIALAQLNRQPAFRESPRPRITDLRESGALEQDPHKVLLLHRPNYAEISMNPEEQDTGEAEIIIAKNRKGPCGIIKCGWIREFMSFKDIPSEEF